MESAVIVQNDMREAQECADNLRGSFNVIEVTDDVRIAIDSIRANKPDFLVTSFTLRQSDGIELIELAKEKGNQYIHDMLKKVDPVSAENIHMNNVKRVARALEYYKQTGELMSKHNEEQSEKESPYNYVYFVLNDDREVLYNRINERIDKMVEDGLLNEVESLLKKGYNENLVSMQGLGYKEIVPYIKGECTLLEALYILKRDTRHFAKRQLTWFRREPDVTMLDISQYGSREKVYEKMLEILKEREITK